MAASRKARTISTDVGKRSSGRMCVAREVCRMPESFGARLRQRREKQKIALTTIAEQTKIKLSLLEALERDDLSRWPEGIFRRAFVRAYAHAIGLEPDVVVREFLDFHPDPVEVVATAPTSITVRPTVEGRRRGFTIFSAPPSIRCPAWALSRSRDSPSRSRRGSTALR